MGVRKSIAARIPSRLLGGKENLVQRSLTVLLPVKNAQSTLVTTVHEILDVVSELSERIELLIIDDGSADATSEVATELSRHYPQVRMVCHGRSLGREAAIRTGLQETTGEVVLIQEEERGRPLDEIVRKWKDSNALGHNLFRRDSSENRREIRPKHSSDIPQASLERRSERQPRVSSRPRRPNFMVRLRDNSLGE
jgi:glycosyltransferase involved in cell wall biosynthesis